MEQDNISHTFAILAYKESPYLEECIKSLKAQDSISSLLLTTSTPNQFIEGMSRKYAIPYLINPHGGSIGADWNFAFQQSDSHLVTLAHQDDLYVPSFAREVKKAFGSTKNNDKLLVFTDYYDMLEGKLRIVSKNAMIKKLLLFPFALSRSISWPLIKKSCLALGDPICCPSVTLYKKKLSDFRFDESLACAIDWDAWYRLASEKGSFHFINQKLMVHRIHPGSETTAQLNNGRRLQEEKAMFEKIWGSGAANLLSRIYKYGHKDNLS